MQPVASISASSASNDLSLARVSNLRYFPVLVAVLILVALVPSALVAYGARDLPYLGHYQDDGLYWGAANALAEGRGYRIDSLPGQPSQTKYPPVFPVLLSLVWVISPVAPDNLPVAALFIWLALPVFVAFSYAILRSFSLTCAESAGLVALIAINPIAVLLATNVMSELLCTCFIFATIIVSDRAMERNSGWIAALSGLLAGLAFLTKTAALAMVLSGVLYLCWKRQRRNALFFALAAAPAVAGWIGWVNTHHNGAPEQIYYTDYLRFHLQQVTLADIPALVSRNMAQLVQGIGGLIMFRAHDSRSEQAAAIVLGLSCSFAIVARCRQRFRLLHAFSVVYIAILVCWHFPPNERFLVPLFPIVFLGVADILRSVRAALTPFIRPALLRIAGIAVVALLVGVDATALAFDLPEFARDQRVTRFHRSEVFQWMRERLAPGSRVLAYTDVILHANTGLTAMRVGTAPIAYYRSDRSVVAHTIDDVQCFAIQHGFQYFLFTPDDYRLGELLPSERDRLELMLSRGPGFSLLFEKEGIRLYRILSLRGGTGCNSSSSANRLSAGAREFP